VIQLPAAPSDRVAKMAVTLFDRPELNIGDGIFTLLRSGFVLASRFPLREYWIVVDLFAPVTLTLTR